MSDVPTFLIDELFADTREGVIRPQIETLPNGNFLVAYYAGDRFGIRGQQYDAEGNKIGEEIIFEVPVVVEQPEFDVFVKPNGQVVLAVETDTLISTMPNHMVVTFDLDEFGGLYQNVDQQRISVDALYSSNPTFAGYDNGDFNLFWHQESSFSHFLDGLGVRGEETIFRRADPFVGQDDADISAAVLNNNTTVVLLDRDSDQGLRSKFDVRFFDEDLKQFQFREIGGGARTFDPTVEALTGGGYAVAWSQLERVLLRASDQDTEVFVQVFDQDGNPTSPKMRVGESRNNDLNTNARIVALDDGGFIVFYDKNRHEPSLNGQRFGEDGARIGPEFRVFDGAGGNIDATLLPDNRVAVSFEADGTVRTETFDVNAILRGAERAGSIVGTDEDDILEGGDGNERFDGLDGDDLIRGGEGSDRIDGGRGFDTVDYAASDAAVEISLLDPDQSGGHAQNDVLISVEGVIGSAFDDTLIGDNNANVLDGGDGDDILDGGRGRDILRGGAGDDVIIGRSDGAETYDGGDGNDTLRTISRVGLFDDDISSIENLEIQAVLAENALARLNASQMTFETISFNSVSSRAATIVVTTDETEIDLSGIAFSGFLSGRDSTELVGNGAANSIIGSEIDDFVRAGGGDDTIAAGAGDDHVRAGNGNDTIFGGAGDDFLRGEDGNDVIDGGAGADVMEGGNGRDTASYAASDAAVEISLAIGDAAQRGGEAEGDVLRNIENVTGSVHDDTLTGNDGANVLRGGAGDDVLIGRGGADTVMGGAGDDLVIVRDGAGRSFDGGAGFDTLRVIDRVGLNGDDDASGFEALEIVAAAGRDALLRIDAGDMSFSKISFTPVGDENVQVDIHGDGTNVNLSNVALENFDFPGAFRFLGSDEAEGFIGTALNDQINGGDGDDRLFGRAGDDALNGDAGNDILEGNEGNDVMNGGAGDDVMFGGDGNDLLKGGTGNDVLNGGGGVDVLEGEDGDDELVGGAEADTLLGGNGKDVIRGNGGDDVAIGGNGADLIFGSAGNDALFGGDGNDTIEGNKQSDDLFGQAGNDILRGGDGFDFLDGGAGKDTLNGGKGNDVLIGDLGGDSLRGGAGTDSFVFLSVPESTIGAEDVIQDMEGVGAAGGDLIDLSAIDADQTQAGDQAFTYLGEVETAVGLGFGAGALWVENSGGQTRLFGNVDGDGTIEFALIINDGAAVVAADYTTNEFLL